MKELEHLPSHLERMHWQSTEAAVVYNSLSKDILRTVETDPYAISVYERKAAIHLKNRQFPMVEDIYGLYAMTSDIMNVQASEIVDTYLQDRRSYFNEALIDRVSDFTYFGRQTAGGDTYKFGLMWHLKEGLSAGLHTPSNLLGVVLKAQSDIDPRTEHTYESSLETMKSDWFLDLLHEAAKAHNGLWGGFSGADVARNLDRATTQFKLALSSNLIELLDVPLTPLLRPIYTGGLALEFTPEARKEILSSRRNGNNKAREGYYSEGALQSLSSAGCPVMHTEVEFIKGSSMHIATKKALGTVGIAGLPHVEGTRCIFDTSSIEDARDLVAARIELALANNFSTTPHQS